MGLGRTARYYKYGSTVSGKSNPAAAKRARKKKKETNKKINSTPSNKAKRAELGRERYKRKKKGQNLEGKDIAHTKSGFRVKDSSKNRGSKSDMPGDKRARGKGRKKKK